MFHSNHTKRFLKTALITITWVPVLMAINDKICYISQIHGNSMRPTLNPTDSSKDWVFLWKLNKESIDVDDIILLKSPMDPKKILCKRIKAKSYDKVQTIFPYPKDSAIIPRNHSWVEGDNVTHSIDSNTFGPISNGLILGKVTRVIWPPYRWGVNLQDNIGREGIIIKDDNH
ncbi:endopeptidase catalytic subunit NDAI_0B01360 [Naumovozyma dairenensis CBS 421]|uniref:Mitochondrial inner membrane protease subunit 2 n=1 Tax=Naumovozyma dairenensis (strain ATCC 10597 / BCRC 20456 / CBS 421 / NBRC 0211 / NRRL Y-12639) TaxID=1071378 RepID=G0W5V9_NAUDC|nr:hypothetical protein NDAI_0B01360 [Naumovozyma dairenensis CBS 421]CCD23170.1 hypothetical protein NDAI_0B01360 [Naumovozyma dairenensis CBS 421]